MKHLILFALVLFGYGAQAQYFQHIYGGARTTLNSGENVSSPDVAHVMGGIQTNDELVVTACDPQGGFTNPSFNFNNTYTVSDLSGIQLALESVQVIKLQGPGYGVIARSEIPGSNTPGIIYFSVDDAGNVSSSVREYTCNIAGTGWKVNLVTRAIQASNTLIYIIGNVGDPATGGKSHPFILNIDVSGTPNWLVVNEIAGTSTGSNTVPYDIVESPYNTEVVLVGGMQDVFNGPFYGFFMAADINTGIATRTEIYGGATYNSAFSSIDVANNPLPNGAGFILGGWSDANGNNDVDMWAIKVDGSGQVPQWSYLYDYHLASSSSEYGWDIIERQNTTGTYEYYISGHTSMGSFGNTDALVIKIDDMGNAYPNGEFTYGTPTTEEIAKRIDAFDGTLNDGLGIYSTEYDPFTNRKDMLLVKAYFNGFTACNYNLDDPIQTAGPTYDRSADLLNYNGLNFTPLTTATFITKDNQVCFSATVPGGDNSFKVPAEPDGFTQETTFNPNPMNHTLSLASVEVEVANPTSANVYLYDLLGKQYYSQSFDLTEGKNTLDLDLSNSHLAQGVYTLKVTGENLYKTISVLVD